MAACRAKQWNRRVAAESYHLQESGMGNSFFPYRRPGKDGIFPALLQQGQRIVIPYLVKIFCACLDMGYVTAMWHQVKVVFIPKPSRYSYTGPRDFKTYPCYSVLA